MTIKRFLFFFACIIGASATAQNNASINKPASGTESQGGFYQTPYSDRSNGTFGAGANLFSISYGVPNTLYREAVANTYGANVSGFGPLMVRDEFAVRAEVGIAISFQYANKKWDSYDWYSDYIKVSTKGVNVGVCGIYHFCKLIPVRKLDAYLGFGASLDFDSGNVADAGTTSGTVMYGERKQIKVLAMAGLRYYLSKGFGVFMEGGAIGYSSLNTGLTIRFK